MSISTCDVACRRKALLRANRQHVEDIRELFLDQQDFLL